MSDVEHLSIFIALAPEEVYAFVADVRNLPQWAAGLARSELRKEGDAWVAKAPFGEVRIRFAPKNDFGVLDHDVELENGVVVHNPMRVLRRGEGSEFLFTLYRQAGMSDEDFAADRQAIVSDLQRLKELLEA